MSADTFLGYWIKSDNSKETNLPQPLHSVHVVKGKFCGFYKRCFAQCLEWQKLFLRLSSDLCLTVTISQAAAIALHSKLSGSKLLCLPNPLFPKLSHTSGTLCKLAFSVSSPISNGVSGFNRWNHARIMDFTRILPECLFPKKFVQSVQNC